jgi:hypothetical protein
VYGGLHSPMAAGTLISMFNKEGVKVI